MLDRTQSEEYYVLMVEEGRELTVEKRIGRRDFQTFLPMVSTRVRFMAKRPRPVRTVSMPALPGYVFVANIVGMDWQTLRCIKGVQGVVGMAGEPYPIAQSVLSDSGRVPRPTNSRRRRPENGHLQRAIRPRS